MRKPLINLHSDLDTAASEGVIVTGTRRQARELKYSYDYQKIKEGNNAWKSARILPIQSWLRLCYESLPTELKPATILSKNSSLVIAAASAPLNSVRSHTAQFMEAWDLCWETNLWPNKNEIGQTENGKLFLSWANSFQKNLRDGSSITASELPLRIIDSLKAGWVPASAIYLFGLRETKPCLTKLFEMLSIKGLTTKHETQIRPDAKASDIIEFGTTDQEILGAVLWARTALSDHGDNNRIGIVVDDIEKNYRSIRRQVGSAFPDINNLDEIINIGSGPPLLTESLGTDTLDFLDWFKLPHDYHKLERWSNQPYFSMLELPRQLSHKLPERLTLNELAKSSNNRQLLALMQKFEARAISNMPDGIQIVLDLLNTAGWNEISPDSQYFQAREQILEVLAETASMNFLNPNTWEDLVSTIRMTAGGRSLAPKTASAPIQIIGRHDLSELEFDLLWVSGMSDSSWPGTNHPNIFIPNSLQAQVESIAATPNSWLKHTSEITRNWRKSTQTLQFSYALNDGENESQPSPLVAPNRIANPSKVLSNIDLISFGHPWIQNRGMKATELFIDDFGSVVPSKQIMRGGASIVRNQTLCPFRGWAKHRLELKERLSPHRFPNLLDQGNMVHNLLYELTIGRASKLEITNITDEDVDAALNKLFESFSFIPPLTLAQERDRLKKLMNTWIEAERARPDYTIEDVEQEREIQLGNLLIKIRLDRIDRTNDNSVLIIDYKTGSSSLASWKPPRMPEPQLPLYAVSDENVGAIAFMHINNDSVRLRGIGDPAMEDKNIDTPDTFDEETFISLKNRWRESLLKTSSEFMAGYAKVDPFDPNRTCRQCDLHSLCRIYSLQQPKQDNEQ